MLNPSYHDMYTNTETNITHFAKPGSGTTLCGLVAHAFDVGGTINRACGNCKRSYIEESLRQDSVPITLEQLEQMARDVTQNPEYVRAQLMAAAYDSYELTLNVTVKAPRDWSAAIRVEEELRDELTDFFGDHITQHACWFEYLKNIADVDEFITINEVRLERKQP